METILSVFVPIHREGHKFIGVFAVVTFMFFLMDLDFMVTIGIILTLWCAYFFRDPDRITPQKEGLIIAPADGVVQSVKTSVPPAELDMGDEQRIRVSIFMNVFDVHVNRVPADGKIIRQVYTPGKYLNASLEKACEDNERHALLLETTSGKYVAFVQIAGLVARRILCWAEDEKEMKAGERFGLIRFGSRVDVYLPKGVNSLVSVGQRAIAGETVIASEKGREKNRDGEIR
ncbi:MAG: phosphatidylserine decarboxylase [Kordiimonadaceae bacterium]|nr:phosphatidylserine decarboxylase [Kordiimonadaceae bacterium]MBT6036677.1 phosphatidylserine decarboxylase [Kordiimonadaceae bacterium]MBT7582149.1 phosphatidylserine decarboxylase [Kordiimonadaceae bacterium]